MSRHYILVLLLAGCFFLMCATKALSVPMNDTLRIGTLEATAGKIKGTVTNVEGAPLGGIIVRAVHLPDSVVKGGTATDTLGVYEIESLPFGSYLLKCEAIGYTKGFLRFSVAEDRPLIMANPIRIDATDLSLGEAVVVGQVPLVTVTDDTVAYNASALATSEGAMAEELITQIPGAEITEDGKIKINGKEYSKILIDGKEFFGDDVSATLQNLPANIVRRIKTYDRRSDRARLTGIDDGEEHNVIDIEVKKDMFKGLVGNIGLSLGNYDRYAERVNVNKFRSNQHAAIVMNMNNVNNPAFSERGSGASNASRQARTGYTASKSVGFTYAKEKRRKYKVSGNVRYSFSDADNESERHTETKYATGAEYYNNNNSRTDRKRNELNANFEWEWRPDTLTTIQMRPNFSYNKTDNVSSSRGLSSRWLGGETDTLQQTNSTNSLNVNGSDGVTTNASLLLFRRLSRKGRNISINGSVSYSDNNSTTNVRNFATYTLKPLLNRNYDRYMDGGTYRFGYSAGFNYTEPLFNKTYLQLRYDFNYSHSRTNRMGYEYNHDAGDTIFAVSDIDWSTVPFDTTLSNITDNKYYSHSFNLNMRHVTTKMNLNYGVHLNPRHNESNYILGQRMDKGIVKQNLKNWAPNLHFKYRFTKRNSLDINYNGSSSEANVEQLQELIDKTNPQYIRYGNPHLKPSFTHRFNTTFNMYGEKSHRSLVTNWGYSNTSNAISTMSFSESSTGFRISKLMNVSGQWNMNGNINFNMPLDSLQRWNISTVSSCSYNENTNFNSTPLSNTKMKNLYKNGITSLANPDMDPSHLNLNKDLSLQYVAFNDIDKLRSEARINHTSSVRLFQSVGLRFHMKTFSWRVGGSVSYYRVHNSVKNGLSRETFDYNANANLQVELPFNSQLSTTANFNSRHGYSSGIQKNICVWNAQLTKRLFKHNAGLLSFQIYDLLHQRTNITRSINALSISDTKQLMLQDYFMFSFQYNFNTLRNKRHMARNSQNGQRPQMRNSMNNRNNSNVNRTSNNNNRTGNNGIRQNYQSRMRSR